ncbi:MAG: hypothetical protein SOY65_01550 [Marinifilaceae bacterium]|nr:hypothetical protein [Marinifilaceae bacterium]
MTNTFISKTHYLTGIIGDHVLYTRNGRTRLRQRPSPSLKPVAPGVAAQRERMASVAIFYRCARDAGLFPFWQRASAGSQMNGYTLLTRENLPAFEADGTIRDFDKLQPTPDLMPLPDHLGITPSADGGWTIRWDVSEWLPGTAADDRLCLLVMRDESTFALKPLDTGGARRADGEAHFTLPDELTDFKHLFVYFTCSRTEATSSKSKYFDLNSFKHETFF